MIGVVLAYGNILACSVLVWLGSGDASYGIAVLNFCTFLVLLKGEDKL